MGQQTIYMGLDIGTTSTKGVLSNLSGDILAESMVEYPIHQPQPGYAEQDPDEISRAVWMVARQLMRAEAVQTGHLAAIGFSSAMHSVILVDEAHQPLTPCIIWADNRSAAEATELLESGAGLELYRKTGTPIHPMSPLTKLRWMSRMRPQLLKGAHKVISIKEYVLYQLCKTYAVDYSIASTTGLFNLSGLEWDREALEYAGIRPDQLSRPVPTTHILEITERKRAAELGIPPQTPIVIGASDGVLANLGVGAITGESAAITIGTSGAVRTVRQEPLTDERMRSFCYTLTEGYWVVGGPINNGGIALKWFKDQFAGDELALAAKTGENVYDIITREAARIQPGSEGLLFLPYLTGERAPHWNAQARGVFFGAGLNHRRQHFIRAVLEGVIFSAFSVYQSLMPTEQSAKSLLATGGFVRSPVWLQMTADVFGVPVLVPASRESACLGAVMLAMLATGAASSLDETRSLVRITDTYIPNEKHTEAYRELYALFADVYRSLVPHFDTLSKWREAQKDIVRVEK
ncbi:gluconokinase [Brevibacillus borstelensis]|uniref:gluconokinase n=1 Tax=Brevibacillus borstelensis TaxID=45462 RepID=UPI0030C5AB18